MEGIGLSLGSQLGDGRRGFGFGFSCCWVDEWHKLGIQAEPGCIGSRLSLHHQCLRPPLHPPLHLLHLPEVGMRIGTQLYA